MKTVAILSQKGGTGKTTLTLHLAVEAERKGAATVIVDLDPQASATSWSDLRQSETPAVISAQATRLAQVLATVEAAGAALVLHRYGAARREYGACRSPSRRPYCDPVPAGDPRSQSYRHDD